VSYGIIREHGGDIAVQSQPGKGTQFVLTFPVGASGALVLPQVKRAAPGVMAPVPAAAATSGSEARMEVATSVPSAMQAKSDILIQ